MLYQKGEKLEILKETLKAVPKISELKDSNFSMSEEELQKFKSSISCEFNNLNTALYNTLLNGKEEINKENVKTACDNIVVYLKEHFKADLVDSFYEEKQHFYDFMFFILIDDLIKHYPEYQDSLKVIQQAYTDLRNEENIFDFPEIEELIEDYKEIKRDITRVYCDSTKAYLTHSIELIFEKISELVKEECKKQYLCMDVLPNKLRKLIYLLKKKLEFKLDSKDSDM